MMKKRLNMCPILRLMWCISGISERVRECDEIKLNYLRSFLVQHLLFTSCVWSVDVTVDSVLQVDRNVCQRQLRVTRCRFNTSAHHDTAMSEHSHAERDLLSAQGGQLSVRQQRIAVHEHANSPDVLLQYKWRGKNASDGRMCPWQCCFCGQGTFIWH